MRKIIRAIALLTLVAFCAASVNAQFYTNRKHDNGNDTLWVYNSWESVFFDGPDTLAVNPNIEINSPFNFRFTILVLTFFQDFHMVHPTFRVI